LKFPILLVAGGATFRFSLFVAATGLASYNAWHFKHLLAVGRAFTLPKSMVSPHSEQTIKVIASVVAVAGYFKKFYSSSCSVALCTHGIS
jgi:hypothetical protein